MLKNLKIGTRLFLLVGFLSLLLIVVGLEGLRGFKLTLDQLELIYKDGVISLDNLRKTDQAFAIKIVNTLNKIQNDSKSFEEGSKIIESTLNKGNEYWGLYTQGVRQSGEEKEAVERTKKLIDETNSSIHRLLAILQRQNREELTTYISKELPEAIDPLSEALEKLIDIEIKHTNTEYMQGVATYETIRFTSIITIILGMLIGLIFAAFIIKGITKPLAKAVDAANRISIGDTDIDIKPEADDEVGDLLIAMKKMVASTNNMVEALVAVASGDLTINITPRSQVDVLGQSMQKMITSTNEMANALSSVTAGDLTVKVAERSKNDILGSTIGLMINKLIQSTSELRKEVDVLANSTGKIVSSVSEVSSSTAETASAVTETTTTVEELKQTAQASAEKAKYVLTSAEEAIRTLKNSEKSLGVTIDGMRLIQERMTMISESIIKLSELSQMIGEIIDTVNDIAEQSNLLAVNAAIEAAKAGDQGKGFAVVAEEVRSLAEQSKQATVQVHTILNDIQKATSSAVMATEQGSKAVSKGVNQSSETNESIRALSEDVSRVAEAASQISVSSQQQLVGVSQVTTAMMNINEATNQHVAHMRQIETAVQDLNAVGITLMKLVQQNKL